MNSSVGTSKSRICSALAGGTLVAALCLCSASPSFAAAPTVLGVAHLEGLDAARGALAAWREGGRKGDNTLALAAVANLRWNGVFQGADRLHAAGERNICAWRVSGPPLPELARIAAEAGYSDSGAAALDFTVAHESAHCLNEPGGRIIRSGRHEASADARGVDALRSRRPDRPEAAAAFAEGLFIFRLSKWLSGEKNYPPSTEAVKAGKGLPFGESPEFPRGVDPKSFVDAFSTGAPAPADPESDGYWPKGASKRAFELAGASKRVAPVGEEGGAAVLARARSAEEKRRTRLEEAAKRDSGSALALAEELMVADAPWWIRSGHPGRAEAAVSFARSILSGMPEMAEEALDLEAIYHHFAAGKGPGKSTPSADGAVVEKLLRSWCSAMERQDEKAAGSMHSLAARALGVRQSDCSDQKAAAAEAGSWMTREK